jgi:GT2 family glycosyltransferase
MIHELVVVMPVKSNLAYTQEALQSLRECTETNFSLVLVDNQSIDNTTDWVSKFCGENGISLAIEKFAHTNIARMWNIGVVRAKEWRPEFIAVINNDIVVYKHWWREVQDFFSKNDALAVVPKSTRKNKPADWSQQAESALLDKTSTIAPLCGWFMLFKAVTFETIGLFDERFRLWYNDTDYYIRLQRIGRPFIQLNSVLIHHYESKTLCTIPTESIVQEDRRLFYEKLEVSSLQDILYSKNFLGT